MERWKYGRREGRIKGRMEVQSKGRRIDGRMEVQLKGRKDQWKDGSTFEGKEGSREGWKHSRKEGRINEMMEVQLNGRKDR